MRLPRTPAPLATRGDDRSAARPGAVVDALAAVREAPSMLLGLRGVDDLLAAAAGGGETDVDVLLDAAVDPSDGVTAAAAVHGLGRHPGSRAREVLTDLLADGAAPVREHAAWALGRGGVHAPAVDLLVELVAGGGFPGMLAQRTLERWAAAEPLAVAGGVRTALAATADTGARTRLVETLGLVRGTEVVTTLRDVAADPAEDDATRAAADAALGDLTAVEAEPVSPLHPARWPARGLTVAQLFLHADIDAGLTHAGRGDTGGIATLLVQLGDALVQGDGSVTRTLTLSRTGAAGTPVDPVALAAPGHHYAGVPLWGTPPRASAAWPLRVAARRGVRRALRAAGRVDVIHLRMADVGSMVAAEVAAELGIRVVLTLAPDPHALVEAREQAGSLTRAAFGAADHAEHLVFRDRLLRGLARAADHLVLLPRADLTSDVHRLLGLDLAEPGVRASVVGEGVDLRGLDRARRAAVAARRTSTPSPALADLDDVLDALPPERRGLPLLLSVGRLHPVKGMASLVRAWAGDPHLATSCNLLVVGGDLDDPSEEESAELDRIHAVVPTDRAASAGLLVAGHRPNPVVREWMAAARAGRPGLAAPHGAYASASLKEEFGIAIVEAVASGLLVVAPDSGGPATYVEDGLTGVLTDTSSAPALTAALRRVLALAGDEVAAARAEAARERLRRRVGIEQMAAALVEVYRAVATDRSGGAPVTWTAR